MKTILCVDDEAWVLKSIRRLLRASEIELMMATSGKAALALLAEKPAQLILADFRMPDMSGIEFLKLARDYQPSSVHILLSSWTDGQQIRQGLNEGSINKVISKPWNNDELLTEIHNCLEPEKGA